jgi:hypothetical protein
MNVLVNVYDLLYLQTMKESYQKINVVSCPVQKKKLCDVITFFVAKKEENCLFKIFILMETR